MNLNHWANGAWANGTWVPSSWGSATPVVSGGSNISVEIGDGYVRTGNVVRWLNRPRELEPVNAEAITIKKVSKSLGISKRQAANVVGSIQRELANNINYLHAANMATSGIRGDIYTPEEIGDIRQYWREVVKLAGDMEDDDEIMLLLS